MGARCYGNRCICGVIKQNQSEVGQIQFSVSYWIVTSICLAISQNQYFRLPTDFA